MDERAMKKRRETARRHREKVEIALLVILVIATVAILAPKPTRPPARAADSSVPLHPWPPSSADRPPFYFWLNKPSKDARPVYRRDPAKLLIDQ
jgi:hypothetical protein